MRTGIRTAFAVALAIAFALITPVAYAVPSVIDFQGKLADSSGAALTGAYNMTFYIYNQTTGGAMLWKENKLVSANGGLFSTLLGSVVPINLTFGENYFIEMNVSGEIFSPRYRIGTVPYSFRSNISEYAIAGNTATPSFTIKRISGQASNMTQWVDESGNVLAAVDNQGRFIGDGSILSGIGQSATTTRLPASNITSGTFGASFGDSGEYKFSGNVTVLRNFTVGTNSLFVSQLFTLAGIGTATPTARLHVNGTNPANNLSLNVNNTLYVNSSRVGIGTSSPTSALYVVGTATFTNITLASNCADGEILKWYGGAGICGADQNGASMSTAGGWTNDSTTTSTSLSVIIDSLTLVANATTNNVGIGTNAPVSRLHVAGNVTIDGTLYVMGTNVTGRQESDNTTISGNLTSTNARIGALDSRESSNNATQNNLATSNNNTVANNLTSTNARIGALETKQSSDNTTLANNLTAIANRIAIQEANNVTQNNLITSNNNTVANNLTTTNARIGSLETKQSSDNTTLSNRIAIQEANNITQANLISSLDSRQSSDNTTIANNLTAIANRIAIQEANNVTQAALLGLKVNLSNTSFECPAGQYAYNVTTDNGRVSGLCRVDQTATSSNISGSGNTGYIARFTNATHIVSSPLFTDNVSIGIGTTILNALLTIAGNSTISGTLFVDGINVTGRQISDNTTIANNLTTTNARIGALETKQSADNSTVANNLTSTNARIGFLESKQSSDNTTLTNRINTMASDNTTQANLISALDSRQSSDNTTLANNLTSTNARIGATDSRESANNATQAALLGQKLNITGGTISGLLNITGNLVLDTTKCSGGQVLTTYPNGSVYCTATSGDGAGADNQTLTDMITGNNNTITGMLGQKVNLSNTSFECPGGQYAYNVTTDNGRVSGLCRVDQTATSSNISGSGNTGYIARFTNATHIVSSPIFTDNTSISIGTTILNALLTIYGNATISGTLFVDGINVTGRQISDNTTLANNLTTTNTRIGTLETKQSSDNTTLANRIATQEADNTTLTAMLGQKVNLSNTSFECPADQYAYNVTTDNGIVSGLCRVDQTTTSANISGSGQENYTARFLNATHIVAGSIYDNGSAVGIGTASPRTVLDVTGDLSGTALYNQTFDNMKSNGGFESGTTDGWTVASGGAVSANLTDKKSGIYSLRIYNSSTACNNYVYEDIDVMPNSSYSVSAWIKTVNYTDAWFNGSGAGLYVSEGTGTGCTQWTRSLRSTLFNGSAGWIKVYVENWNSNNCMKMRVAATIQTCGITGEAFFDDFMVTEGYSPKGYYAKPIVDSKNGSQWILGGNIGIGTTAPFAGLSIYKASDSVPALSFGSATWGWNIYERLTDGDLKIDAVNSGVATNVMYLDRSSGFIGIGTINPHTKLDVNGTLNVTNITLSTNCADGQVLKWSGGVGTCGSDSTATSSNISGSGQENYTARFLNATHIVAGTIYDNGTNVGIGTTAPSVPLEVYGSIFVAGTGSVIINGTLNNNGILFRNNSGFNRWIVRGTNAETGSNSGFDLNFVSSNDTGSSMNSVITLQRTGSVGIGATIPSAKLDVQGTNPVNNLSLNVNNTLFVNSSGNVGIGTTNPITQLHVAGTVTNLSQLSTGSNPISMYVQGRYAYVVNYNGNTLQIIDISNPSSPASVSTAATGTHPMSVFIHGKYAYVANYDGNTLQIIDVSNPASPSNVSTTPTGTNPRDVFVQGRYAYVANYIGNTLQIIDVSNPAAPVNMSTISITSNPRNIYVSGKYAYVSRYNGNTLQIIDISNPSSPASVATTPTGPNPAATFVQGRYAYVTNAGGATLQIIDISNPASPANVSTTPTSTGPVSVFVQGRYAYVVNYNGNTLQIIDISNPSSPASVATTPTGPNPAVVFVQGRYAYTITYTNSNLQIFNLGGAYIQQLEAGSLETSTLAVSSNAYIGNDIDVRGSATIGRGAYISGPVSIYSNSTISALKVIGTINATNITLASNCADGQVLKWSGGAGICGSDATSGGANTTSSGNTGYIARFTNETHIVSSPIFTDNASVGINTTSVTSLLDIAADVSAAALSGGGANQLELSGSSDATKNLLIGFETENNYGYIQTLRRGLSWTDFNLSLQPKGGNVGIGTTNPASKLHVYGGYMIVEQTGGVQTYLGSTASASFVQSSGTYPLYLYSGTTQAVTILNSGNVGIGTNTPYAMLHVAGNTTINGTLFVMGTNVTGRQESDNTTISNNLTSTNAWIGTLEVRQNADNNTLSNRIAIQEANNVTQAALLGLKVNLSNTSFECPAGQYAYNVTTDNGRVSGLCRTDSSGNASASGNTGYISRFTNATHIVSSPIFTDNTSVGIGATILNALITIMGSNSANNLSLNVNNTLYVNASGNVGIGTSSPSQKLTVSGTANFTSIVLGSNCADGQVLKWSGGIGTCGSDNSGASSVAGWQATLTAVYNDTSTVNVGIGTSVPSQKLTVVGNANVTGTLFLSNITPVGTNLAVLGDANFTGNVYYGGNMTGYGADVAEYVSGAGLEPGDVVVISTKADKTVEKTSTAYDTKAAGIVSTNPSQIMGAGEGNVLLALAGRVPVKVTTEGGIIKRGDLLTTSSTPGYAMKCASRDKCAGSIIGKAMQEFSSGNGMIIALVVIG